VRWHAVPLLLALLAGAQPESIAFDTAAVAPDGVEFVLARRLQRGPLLTRPGQLYEISFRDAPPGRYPFRSVPHGSLGMRGVVVVE
jgi:plastocyanin